MRLFLVLLLGFPLVAQTTDARLDSIRALLSPFRTSPEANPKTRGATPAFTTIKHQLRDWIESRVSVLQWTGARWNPDPKVLEEQLNDELDHAGLFCGSAPRPPCQRWDRVGFLGSVALNVQHGSFLVVRSAIGIQECGDDESAYVYKTGTDGHWHRIWQSEQNDYQDTKYAPQRLHQVLVSPSGYDPQADKTEHLILTLGVLPACAGRGHSVYYRVWQTKSTLSEPSLLLDGAEGASISEPIEGNVQRQDVLMEYSVDSFEPALTRREIRHYALQDGRLERVDPVALSPRDFTGFWLSHPLEETSQWTEVANRPMLEQALRYYKPPYGEFASPTSHCKQQPDLWQVSANAGEDAEKQFYFLVRWRPPYRFTMVSFAEHPFPDCTEDDDEADKERSLFPIQ